MRPIVCFGVFLIGLLVGPPAVLASQTAGSAQSSAAAPVTAASAYRFDMTQNGRRMTADEFQHWAAANGIRVAAGRPVEAGSTAITESTAIAAAPATTVLAYRFDMTQNGRRMTADEFQHWKAANGIRVAAGRPVEAGSTANTGSTAIAAGPACAPAVATPTPAAAGLAPC